MKKIFLISILFISFSTLTFSQNTKAIARQDVGINFGLDQQMSEESENSKVEDAQQPIDSIKIDYVNNVQKKYNESYLKCPKHFFASTLNDEMILNIRFLKEEENSTISEINMV